MKITIVSLTIVAAVLISTSADSVSDYGTHLMSCSYEASDTASATNVENVKYCPFYASADQWYEITTCTYDYVMDAYRNRNTETFLTLYNNYNQMIEESDDKCGTQCSSIVFQAQEEGFHVVHMGCYGSKKCEATTDVWILNDENDAKCYRSSCPKGFVENIPAPDSLDALDDFENRCTVELDNDKLALYQLSGSEHKAEIVCYFYQSLLAEFVSGGHIKCRTTPLDTAANYDMIVDERLPFDADDVPIAMLPDTSCYHVWFDEDFKLKENTDVVIHGINIVEGGDVERFGKMTLPKDEVRWRTTFDSSVAIFADALLFKLKTQDSGEQDWEGAAYVKGC